MNEIKVTFDGFKYQGNHIACVSNFKTDIESVESICMIGAFSVIKLHDEPKKTDVGIQIIFKDGVTKTFWESMEDAEAMQKVFEKAEMYLDTIQ